MRERNSDKFLPYLFDSLDVPITFYLIFHIFCNLAKEYTSNPTLNLEENILAKKEDREMKKKTIISLCLISKNWNRYMSSPLDVDLDYSKAPLSYISPNALEQLRVQVFKSASLIVTPRRKIIHFAVCNMIVENDRPRRMSEDGLFDPRFKVFKVEEHARTYANATPNSFMGWSIPPREVKPVIFVKPCRVISGDMDIDNITHLRFFKVKPQLISTPPRTPSTDPTSSPIQSPCPDESFPNQLPN